MRQIMFRQKSGMERQDTPLEVPRKVDKINNMLSKMNVNALESYRMEISGVSVPRMLRKENINNTKKNSLQNLLAVEYCRQYSPAMFVNGMSIQYFISYHIFYDRYRWHMFNVLRRTSRDDE